MVRRDALIVIRSVTNPDERILSDVIDQIGHTCVFCVCVFVLVCLCVCVFVCVLAVYNKAQAQRISNREFKLWTFLQGTESRVATFLAETCVMSHQSLSRQAKSKYESPTAMEFGCKTLKSDHGSSEKV